VCHSQYTTDNDEESLINLLSVTRIGTGNRQTDRQIGYVANVVVMPISVAAVPHASIQTFLKTSCS
jgi:hypothetical protein